jgi:outer membrane receptor protein involved in Fe transport
MRRGWFITLAVALLFALTAAVPATAQETRGSIEGIVKDATGGALPGVTVTAKHFATSVAQSTVSDSSGVYRFPALPPGLYSVAATLSGFNPTTVEKVEVAIGELLRVNLTMTVAGVTISETVRGELPLVDVKQNAVTATVTAELIDLLPKGRDYLSALSGIAGTNYETEISGSRATGLMIDGASQSENRFLVDGQDTTDLRQGTSGKSVIVDFIDQIQVKQSGYAAEFRATTGGVVSAITKSGTNSYHGDVGADYRGKMLNKLRGDNRPGLRLDPTVSGNVVPAQYFTTPRTSEFETYTLEPVYDIGGPIFKNRAWFFMGYNPLITNQDRTVQWANPVVNGVTYPSIQTFNDKDTDTRYVYNSTIQLTQNLRARINGNNQRVSNGLALPGVDALSFTVDDNGNTLGISNSNAATFNPRSGVHREDANDSYSASVDWIIDNKTYANVTGGYLGANSRDTGGDYYHGIRRTFSGSNINYLDVPANLQFASGYADNLSNGFRVKDNYNRANVSGDLTRFVEWRGQHAFKGGFQFERIGNDVNTGSQFPNVTIFWNGTRTTLDQRSVRGTYGYYSVVQQYTIGNIHSNNLGFFLQDQWTMNQKLTINYGARFDHTDIPSYREENPGITFGWGDKVAPRLGFAYDIKGDSKWKAYGSWGLFYDIEKLEMPRGAWGADRWVTYYWTLDDYNWPSINCNGLPNSGCPGTYIEQNDLRHVSNDPNNNLVDPNLKPYKTGELVFGLDHELTRLMSISTRYVHKWVYNAIEDIGVQVVGIGEVFYIANPGYGLGAYPLGTDFPRTPFPQRDYDAVDVTFRRRLANNWSFTGNFLLSRLYGNYSGLSNSTSESNRNSPNVTRLWDGLFMSFTEKGCPAITECAADGLNYGRISTDRPFQLKLQGTYVMPWGTSVGVNFIAQSGNLQTSTVSYKAVPVMIYGPGNLGRTTTYTNTDLNFAHTLRVWKGDRLTLQLNITNLFDQDFISRLFTSPWRDSLVIPGDNCTLCAAPFFAGFDTRAVQATRNAATPNVSRPDPRFSLPDQYRAERTARIFLKYVF